MSMISKQNRKSILFITLDSCRYDTAKSAEISNISKISSLWKVWSPGNYTYSSHMSMFMGFMPGNPAINLPVVNPKFGKLFRMAHGGIKGSDVIVLEGLDIKEGLKRKGYLVYGTAAVGWFNPEVDTSSQLLKGFDDFYYSGKTWALAQQVSWVSSKLHQLSAEKVFMFMNIGETHVPYYFEGASWDAKDNPCVPFAGDSNDAIKSRIRQRRALEFIDEILSPLLDAFSESTIYICADHGDCWGEDGLWEHGIFHPKVHEVPLWFKISPSLSDI